MNNHSRAVVSIHIEFYFLEIVNIIFGKKYMNIRNRKYYIREKIHEYLYIRWDQSI
jgi:hypothetical protein